jgi:hypothetical protein
MYGTDKDLAFADHVAQEVNCLAGTVAKIFEFVQDDSIVDSVWGEARERSYKKNEDGEFGIDCPVLMRNPDRSVSSGEQGLSVDKRGVLTVARKDLDVRGLSRPKAGDIWLVWGRYYDVTKSSASDGRMFDDGKTIEYEVSYVRRTKAPPEQSWLEDLPTPEEDAQD